MKTLIVCSVAALVLVTCQSSSAVTHLLSGPMDVFQATTNPGNVGNGSGVISGDYDQTSMTLNYSLEWMDLTSTVTNMHFHIGAVGTPGGVDLAIPGPWSSPYTANGIIITSAQETNLLSGDWYVNIHTGDFGGGEIRGQVLVAQIPEPTSVCLFGLAAAAVGMRSRAPRR